MVKPKVGTPFARRGSPYSRCYFKPEVMKTKPILVTLAALVVLVAATALLLHSNTPLDKKAQARLFLNRFDSDIKTGNTDSLLSFFAMGEG